MSSFRRKEKHLHSFSVQNSAAAKPENTADAVQGNVNNGRPQSLPQRKKAGPSVKKAGFSWLGIMTWGGLALLCVAATAVAWDTMNDGYVIHFITHWNDQPKTEPTYDPLPLNDNKPPGPPPEKNLVWVRGGSFWMGSDDPSHPDSNPTHKVYVDGFWMSKFETTNAEWGAFVKDTKYKTIAERDPTVDQLTPFASKEVVKGAKKQKPFSIVFTPPDHPVDLEDHLQWWKLVEGASWKHPQGPESSIYGKGNHPVMQICYLDCEAFLKWKNKKHAYKDGWAYRLPTEAEWEIAARGGKHRTKFTWGDELKPGGKWMANIWQGQFPHENTKEDGYDKTAPVGSYPPNDFGLYDMAGNAWEWCQDYYLADYYENSPEKNPPGPALGFDPNEPGLTKRVQRGGSFLCDASYCERYLTYARGKGEVQSASDNLGFRIILAPVE